MLTRRQAPILLYSLVFGNAADYDNDGMHRHLWQSHASQADDDQDHGDFLPEDVDDSEAGWATDYAIAVLGLCFFITSLRKYPAEQQNLIYLHFGTAWAHFFGGCAHALFPNRASDGTGILGFYICMILGYAGNCMRWGVGWGLGKYWVIAAAANVFHLVVAGYFAISQMQHTAERRDDAPASESAIPGDTAFGYGEILCAVGELAASGTYLWQKRHDKKRGYIWVAVWSNWIGWVSVYALGLWSVATDAVYNSQATQLIFHYAMMVMLWALNEIAIPEVTKKGKREQAGSDDSV